MSCIPLLPNSIVGSIQGHQLKKNVQSKDLKIFCSVFEKFLCRQSKNHAAWQNNILCVA